MWTGYFRKRYFPKWKTSPSIGTQESKALFYLSFFCQPVVHSFDCSSQQWHKWCIQFLVPNLGRERGQKAILNLRAAILLCICVCSLRQSDRWVWLQTYRLCVQSKTEQEVGMGIYVLDLRFPGQHRGQSPAPQSKFGIWPCQLQSGTLQACRLSPLNRWQLCWQ